jgi:hypothetical protein
MIDIRRLLREGLARTPVGVKIRAHAAGALVEFPGGRKQVVSAQMAGERLVLLSRVLGNARVDGMGVATLLPQVWQRNRQTRCVAFGIDESGRLVGRIEQMAATLQPEELVFYLALLARECDQFEFALTGRDLS